MDTKNLVCEKCGCTTIVTSGESTPEYNKTVFSCTGCGNVWAVKQVFNSSPEAIDSVPIKNEEVVLNLEKDASVSTQSIFDTLVEQVAADRKAEEKVILDNLSVCTNKDKELSISETAIESAKSGCCISGFKAELLTFIKANQLQLQDGTEAASRYANGWNDALEAIEKKFLKN